MGKQYDNVWDKLLDMFIVVPWVRLGEIEDRINRKKVQKENRNNIGEKRCRICMKRFSKYYSFEKAYLNRLRLVTGKKIEFNKDYQCPYCGSLSRLRMLASYMENEIDPNEQFKMCYMAPTKAGLNWCKQRYVNAEIITNDLYMSNCDYQCDIQDMKEFTDNMFDYIICSHILEHIADDKKAMSEMNRILCKGGKAFIIVPLDLKTGFCEENRLSEWKNWKKFGDGTHVRNYTEDVMKERLIHAGFRVEEIKSDSFDSQVKSENGFWKNDIIFVAEKI